MNKSSNKVKGLLLLNFSVAIYLFATGIMGITGKRGGGEIGTAVTSLFAGGGSGDFNKILIVILSVMAIAAGVFIIIRIFGISITHTDTLLIILAVTWIIFILMIDIIYPLNHKGASIDLEWLRRFGSHAMVLAGIVLGTKKFGI
ncbi:hypothetical protein R84B8_01097 [Treponema sp. R8-4-B8]